MANDAPTIINASDLVVRYNDQVVLDHASLALHEGERVGLVGRNGSGKSTFLKILAGLQGPDGGAVTSRRDLIISHLAQDDRLDPALTVYENIRTGARRVLDLISEFESLPTHSKQHAQLEERIVRLDGWGLDHRIPTAMAHLNTPDGARRADTLSGEIGRAS